MQRRYLPIVAMLFFALCSANAQVHINEYSASNLSGFYDNFAKTEDWIELYNTSDAPVDISGWHLSDKSSKPEKWAIPSGAVIPANGFLVFFCSGRDGFIRDQYHTNFKLGQTSGKDIVLLSNASGNVIEEFPLDLTLVEHSHCRTTDGSDEWKICTAPTYGTSNNGTPQISAYTATPSISLAAGYYSGSQTISITNNEPNSVVRYTLDGTNPTISSTEYTAPITIDTTHVLKAQAFSNDPDILPGKMEFNTYLIDEDFSLVVFSVAADGVIDLANGQGELEPIGSIEYFNLDKEREAASFGSLNRHGQDSWVLPHRSLDWISRDEMGYSKAVDAPLFSYSDRDEYQRFMFRNSGDDNYPAIDDEEHEGSTHVRDEFVQSLALEGGMSLDQRAVERVILFLNGQYWGVYGMREKAVDHDYTDEYYDQGKYDIQYLSTWATTEVEYGGLQALEDWENLRDFILNNDMSSADNYQVADDSIKLLSLIDYFVMNQNVVASDWLNYNTGWWRGLNPDGDHKKWGYMLWDLDATFDYYINYTGVPNTDADALPCDIEEISEAMDDFFSNFGGGGFDLEDCLSILDGSSPYPADDPLFIQTVDTDELCCESWDDACQAIYDNLANPNVGEDPEDCPTILNGSSPYPATDTLFVQTIEQDGFCCENDWDETCQAIYDNLANGGGNGGTTDPEDCPSILNGSCPYPADDPFFLTIIEFFPTCCNDWGSDCQDAYDFLDGGGFGEQDTTGLSGITGNVGSHEKIFLKLLEESEDFKQLYYSRYADLMNTVFSCENMNTLLDRMIGTIEPEMPRQIERWGGTMEEWQDNLVTLKSFINQRCSYLDDAALECYSELSGPHQITLTTEPNGV
ncbi:MAG: CotH kinase family protein, partial [Chitinophagales bacterium]